MADMNDAFTMIENLTEELGDKETILIKQEREIALLKKQLSETQEERDCLLTFNNQKVDFREEPCDFDIPDAFLQCRGSVIVITKEELDIHIKWCITTPNMSYEPSNLEDLSEEEWEEIREDYLGNMYGHCGCYGCGNKIGEDRYCYDFSNFTHTLIDMGKADEEWDEHPFLKWCIPAGGANTNPGEYVYGDGTVCEQTHLIRKV